MVYYGRRGGAGCGTARLIDCADTSSITAGPYCRSADCKPRRLHCTLQVVCSTPPCPTAVTSSRRQRPRDLLDSAWRRSSIPTFSSLLFPPLLSRLLFTANPAMGLGERCNLLPSGQRCYRSAAKKQYFLHFYATAMHFFSLVQCVCLESPPNWQRQMDAVQELSNIPKLAKLV